MSACSVDKEDLNGIAAFVASKVEEWKSEAPGSIVAEKFHGSTAGYAYKVSSNGTPSVLCFKLRIREASNPGERALRAGAASAAAAGISPKRYTAGDNWWCEEWGGMNLYEADDKDLFDIAKTDDAAKVGNLLARFHGIDPGWYDSIKGDILAKVGSRIPDQEQLDNFIWFCSSHNMTPPWFPADIQDDGLRKWAQADFFLPQTPIGKRYVTTHGDFHCGNVIIGDDGGLRAIVLDYVSVQRAAFDISYHLAHSKLCELAHSKLCEADRKESRYAFVQAYLKTSGFPAEPQDVSDLLLDAEIYKLGLCIRTPLWDLLLRGHPRVSLKLADELWDAYKEFVSEVRSSKDLQNDVVEMGLYDAIKKNSEKVTKLQNRVAARMVSADSGYGEDVLSGKCPHWCAMPFA